MEKLYHRQAAKIAKCLNWDAKIGSWRFRILLGVLGILAVNNKNI